MTKRYFARSPGGATITVYDPVEAARSAALKLGEGAHATAVDNDGLSARGLAQQRHDKVILKEPGQTLIDEPGAG